MTVIEILAALVMGGLILFLFLDILTKWIDK